MLSKAVLLIFICSCLGASVDLGVRGNWGNAPFFVQLVESLAGHDETLYLPLLKSLLVDDGGLDEWEDSDEDEVEDSEESSVFALSDKLLYEKVAASLSPLDTGFTNLNLVNKIYSPRIAAHHAHFRQEILPEKVQKRCATDSFGTPIENPLGAWVKYGDNVYCSENDLYALHMAKVSEKVHSFDRVIGEDGPVLVFYGDPLCTRFEGMLLTLLKLADSGRLRFVWRYIPDESSSVELSGYGVSLAVKEKKEKPLKRKKAVGNIFQYFSRITATQDEVLAVPAERTHELALKIASYVLDQAEEVRFDLLQDILRNLPLYAPHILELEAPSNLEAVKASAARNEDKGAGFESVGLYINGAVTHRLELDLPKVIQQLSREVLLIQEMVDFGFIEEQAKLVFSKFALLSAYKETEFRTGSTENRFAVYSDVFVPKDSSSGGVVFFNDLERDDSYNLFSEDRMEAYVNDASKLRIGQIPALRENVHDLICVLNFANKHQLKVFFTLSKIVLDRGLAQQIGVLPIVENEKDAYIADLFYRIMEEGESTEALALLYKYYDSEPEAEAELFAKIDLPLEKRGLYGQYNSTIEKYSLTEASVIVNGVIHSMRSNSWQSAMGKQITHDVRFLQQQIRNGYDEGSRLKDLLYSSAKSSRNTRVVPLDPANIRYKKISEEMQSKARTFKTVSDSNDISGTFWLIGDFNSPVILAQFSTLLRFIEQYSSRDLQIKVFHTSQDKGFLEELSQKYGNTPLNSQKVEEIVSRIRKALSQPHSTSENDHEMISILEKNHFQVHHSGMLFNSRYFRLGSVFTKNDLDLLVEYEFSQRLQIFDEITNAYNDAFFWQLITQFNKNSGLTNMDWFDIVSSVVSNSFFQETSMLLSDVSRFDFSSLNYDNAVDLTGYDASKPIDVLAIVDPLDEISPKIAGILTSLSGLPFVNARILLLPLSERTYDLDRFYRGVFLSSKPSFESNGAFIGGQRRAVFEDLPEKMQFTSYLDIPSRWYAVHGVPSNGVDVTNFKGSDLVKMTYNVTRLEVEAYVKNVHTAKSIPGLVLSASNGEELVEGYTLQNLGYLQLLLSPGEWSLLLKKETASSDYFDLLSASENKYQANDEPMESVPLLVSSLMGSEINPRVRKKADFEEVNALSAPLKKRKSASAKINVFSIASGVNYERLMAIMMLSVKKHTTKSIKFWLVENFLSAEFMDLLPQLALKYKFDYELIRYKWPLWLRQQKQLHRTVWGFKMLFLDALFPEDLEKVIFVDADQIARTDLSALADLDLEGAPYGFPPMCDSREGMEGYQFWKKGYWQNVLKDDLKYHISALYVVDLKVFRQNLVGDRLRTHYQKLSSDPNSLANLDQDLPNNLQRQVPIFTLPQDWLWCETWCSPELKKSAKMIDLCNDPTSLESKLDRARRLIPEWESYNKDVQSLVGGEQQLHDEL